MKRYFRGSNYSQINSFLLLTCGVFFLLVYQFPEIIFFDNHFGHQDFVGYHYPIKKFFFESLKTHHVFATYYPNNLQGISLLHNPVHQLFTPLNVYWLVLDFDVAAKLQWFTSYVILGFGCLKLLEYLKFHSSIILFVTLSFLCSGLIWSTHIHPTEIDSLAWMPWVVYFYLLSGVETKSSVRFWRFLCCSWLCLWLYIASGDPWGGLVSLVFCFGVQIFYVDCRQKKLNLKLPIIFLFGSVLIYLPWVLMSEEILPILDRGLGFLRGEQFWYSSHPVRLLEWFFGFMIPPLHSQHYYWPELRQQIYPSWWYYHIYLGIFLATAFIGGLLQLKAKSSHRRLVVFLFFMFIGISFLSFGKFNFLSEWIWTQSSSLHRLRFPERLLKYNLLPILIIAAYGLQWFFAKLSHFDFFKHYFGYIVFTFCLLQLFEVTSRFVFSNTVVGYSIEDMKAPLALSTLKPQDRILVCANGIRRRKAQVPLEADMDPRSWGMATLVAPDSMTGPMMKLLDCTWAISNYAQKWLGYTHVMIPFFDESFHLEISKEKSWMILQEDRENNFVLYKVDEEANNKAYVISAKIENGNLVHPHRNVGGELKLDINQINFERMLEGYVFVDPNHYLNRHGNLIQKEFHLTPLSNPCSEGSNWQSLKVEWFDFHQTVKIDYNLPCDSWVLIPIAFIPGWILDDPITSDDPLIFRFNDQGLMMKAFANQKNIVLRRNRGHFWSVLIDSK